MLNMIAMVHKLIKNKTFDCSTKAPHFTFYHNYIIGGANFYKCTRYGQGYAQSYRVTPETMKQDIKT